MPTRRTEETGVGGPYDSVGEAGGARHTLSGLLTSGALAAQKTITSALQIPKSFFTKAPSCGLPLRQGTPILRGNPVVVKFRGKEKYPPLQRREWRTTGGKEETPCRPLLIVQKIIPYG